MSEGFLHRCLLRGVSYGAAFSWEMGLPPNTWVMRSLGKRSGIATRWSRLHRLLEAG
jgi:hypothetical protein